MPNFLHIADLHHARHTGNAIHAERTSFDIQRDKLQQLASVIREHEIAAVLIAIDVKSVIIMSSPLLKKYIS